MSQNLFTSSIKLAGSLPFNIGETAQNILPMINETNSGSEAYSSNFSYLVSSLMSFIMAVAALAVLIFLLLGAIEWITSAGDKNKLESARNKMMHAALGIIILSATTAIFMVIQQFVGIRVINFLGGSSGGGGATTHHYLCVPQGQERLCTSGTYAPISKCSSCKSPSKCCQLD